MATAANTDYFSANREIFAKARHTAQARAVPAGLEGTAISEVLRGYEEELRQLRAENEQLRRSAHAFGELAERLNKALRNAGVSVTETHSAGSPAAIAERGSAGE